MPMSGVPFTSVSVPLNFTSVGTALPVGGDGIC
jgi:hypothetical protein